MAVHSKLKTVKILALTAGLSFSLTIGDARSGEYRDSDLAGALKNLQDASLDHHQALLVVTDMGPAAIGAVPALVEILRHDPSEPIRGEAAKALGHIGAEAAAAVPDLIAFLKDAEGGYERTYAASALGDIGKQDEEAVPALILALHCDSEPVVKELSARALGGFGAAASNAIPALIMAIQSGDRDLREAAAYGLQKIPARPGDVPALINLLDDEIDSARAAAAKSLGAAKSAAKAAVPKLILALSDKTPAVRAAAASALGAIGPDAINAVPQLKTALNDPETHSEASMALEQIQPTQ